METVLRTSTTSGTRRGMIKKLTQAARSAAGSEHIPRPRKNIKVRIDGSSFFYGWGRPIDGYDSNVIICVTPTIELPPEVLKARNESITKAWSCPVRLKKQSDHQRSIRLQGLTKHSEPGYKERISASMKLAYSDPEVVKKCSDARKKYWAEWRLKNGKTKGKQYL